MRRGLSAAVTGLVALTSVVAVVPSASGVLDVGFVVGSVILPDGVPPSEVWVDVVEGTPESPQWVGWGTADAATGEFSITVDEPTGGPYHLSVWVGSDPGVAGWYHEGPAGTASLTTLGDATSFALGRADLVELDPVALTVPGSLVMWAQNPSALDISSQLVSPGVFLEDPATGWVEDIGSAGDRSAPLGVLAGQEYLVGVNRASGFSQYTGRYFAGDGLLGAASVAGAVPVSVAAAMSSELVTRLDTCATVSGTVTVPAGLHTPTVSVFNDADPDLVTRAANVAPDGTYTVSGLLPGEYYVSAHVWDDPAQAERESFLDGADPAFGAAAPLSITGCNATVDADIVLEVPTGVVSQTPVRLVDDAAVSPDVPRCVQVAPYFGIEGAAGVPADASAVVLNVTADRPTGHGYVVVYPDTAGDETTPRPAGSTVNFELGTAVANAAFVQLPPDGAICYTTHGAPNVRVILDVTGYVMPDAGLSTQASVRLLDTRASSHVGALAGPVPPRQTQTIQVAGQAGLPADAAAVLLNVTVVGATGVGNLRVFPAGGALPNVSTVNYAADRTKANAAVVTLPASGKISFFSDTGSPVEVVLDVVGWAGAGGAYTAITPTRVVDTRPATAVGTLVGPLAGRTVHAVDLSGVAGIPAGATGLVLNVTAIGPTSGGNLRVYPDVDGTGATPAPNASSINYIAGRDIPNLVVVGLPADGRVDFWSDSFGTVQLAVDVLGYLTDPVG